MDLRASIVSSQQIYKHSNGELLVAKHQSGPKCYQAVFAGRGFELAEKMIKNPQTRKLFEVLPNSKIIANTKGLTCRWQPVKSPYRELLV